MAQWILITSSDYKQLFTQARDGCNAWLPLTCSKQTGCCIVKLQGLQQHCYTERSNKKCKKC